MRTPAIGRFAFFTLQRTPAERSCGSKPQRRGDMGPRRSVASPQRCSEIPAQQDLQGDALEPFAFSNADRSTRFDVIATRVLVGGRGSRTSSTAA
jgi:hypothetical protein